MHFLLLRASCTTFFGRKKQCLARITEPSNDDYDNDVSDNCDNYFGTFDDFGVKNDQKVSHYMILMSKYKGQHGGKKGKNIRARPPPLFGQCPKEIDFCYVRSSLKHMLRAPRFLIFSFILIIFLVICNHYHCHHHPPHDDDDVEE